MRHLVRLCCVVLVCLIAACGGGGGSDGGGNPSGNSVTLDATSLSLNLDADQPGRFTAPALTATFRGAGLVIGTPPGAPMLPGWLQVSTEMLGSSSVRVTISHLSYIYPNFTPGRSVYTLRFATGNADGSSVAYRDVPLVVTMTPAIRPRVLAHSTAVGGSTSTHELQFLWDTPWTVRSNAPWVRVQATAGGVSATLDPAGMAEGEHSADITVEDTISHVTKVIPVRMAVEARRLLAKQRGVSLAALANVNRLQATVPVTDNTGSTSLPWRATSDQPWLQLGSATGLTGESLAISANPASLADGLHYAKVTIEAQDGSSAAATSVRVGLFVNRSLTSPARTQVLMRTGILTSGQYAPGFVADPIRPYVYATRGDGRIDLYNVHSAAIDDFITVPEGVAAMGISFDGSRLFAQDVQTGALFVIDLDSRIVSGPWAGPRVSRRMAYTEVNGKAVLVSGELQVIDAQTGTVLADADSPGSTLDNGQHVAVRHDGRAAYFQAPFNANHNISRYALSYHGGVLAFRQTHLRNEPGDASGIAIDWTDGRVLTGSNGATAGGFVYDPTTFVQRDSLSGCCSGAVLTSPDGHFYGASAWNNVLRFNPGASSSSASYTFGDSVSSIALTGNGSRLCVTGSVAAQAVLHFQDVP